MPRFVFTSKPEEVRKVLSNKELLIPQTHLDKVCKCKKGKQACRYISLSAIGHICIKNTCLANDVKENMRNAKWRAMGDNCDGFGYAQNNKEQKKQSDNQEDSSPQA